MTVSLSLSLVFMYKYVSLVFLYASSISPATRASNKMLSQKCVSSTSQLEVAESEKERLRDRVRSIKHQFELEECRIVERYERQMMMMIKDHVPTGDGLSEGDKGGKVMDVENQVLRKRVMELEKEVGEWKAADDMRKAELAAVREIVDKSSKMSGI